MFTIRRCALSHDTSACTQECAPREPAFLTSDIWSGGIAFHVDQARYHQSGPFAGWLRTAENRKAGL